MAEFLFWELVSWHRFHGGVHTLNMKLLFSRAVFVASFMVGFMAAFQAARFHGQFHIYLVEMSDVHCIRMMHSLLLRALRRLFGILT